jgi:hypothetical protein
MNEDAAPTDPLTDEELVELRYTIEHENDPLKCIRIDDDFKKASSLLGEYNVVEIWKNGKLHGTLSCGGPEEVDWKEVGPRLLATYDKLADVLSAAKKVVAENKEKLQHARGSKALVELEKVLKMLENKQPQKCDECDGQGYNRVFRGGSCSGAWDQECPICRGTGKQ